MGSEYIRELRGALKGPGSAPGVRRARFMSPPTYGPPGQLKKTLPAVRLSGTDLRSLCSEITAPPSTAVLMHMKQIVWTAGGAD